MRASPGNENQRFSRRRSRRALGRNAGRRQRDLSLEGSISVSLEWIRGPCPTTSPSHRASAQARQKQLTKPPGSLGLLEAVVIELAALQRTEAPALSRAPIVIFAGDHGVTAQGVSAYPAEVTVQMLRNFASGGAAISVLARELGSPLEIVDVGTFALDRIPGVTIDKPRCGTRDFSQVAALTPAEVDFALECGRRAVARQAGMVPHILILGEMGIGAARLSARGDHRQRYRHRCRRRCPQGACDRRRA
jgi:nicotinate-nucleotide--dimethylbenzimidazole phosphoribosyltransferase